VAELRHVKGLADLQKFLNTLPANVERNIMRGALRAGAKPITALAQSNVTSQEVRAAIKVKVSTRKGRITASISAHTNDNKPFWLEYGTQAHLISVRADARPQRMTRRGLRSYSVETLNRMIARGSLIIGGAFVGASVKHPGARPKPWIRPALDMGTPLAITAMAEYIKKRLARGKDGIKAARDVVVEVD